VEGDREGDREKRGWEAGIGIPKVAGRRKKGKNYAPLCNISQSKKRKDAGASKYRVGTGIKGYRKWEL